MAQVTTLYKDRVLQEDITELVQELEEATSCEVWLDSLACTGQVEMRLAPAIELWPDTPARGERRLDCLVWYKVV
jgi:hypothetical protein